MTTATESTPQQRRTLGDLLNQLGGVSADRVRLIPSPGTATEQDAINNPLCELVDGTLVEKPLGFNESVHCGDHRPRRREFCGLKKTWAGRHHRRHVPRKPRADSHARCLIYIVGENSARCPIGCRAGSFPDLAIEILSPANTVREMERKRQDYFAGGARLIWIVHPDTRTVDVYLPGQGEPAVLGEKDTLDGLDVLPGFAHSIAAIFAEAQRPAE